MGDIVQVTDATFDADVAGQDVPTILDFWGDHCPACIQITPILEELARSYAGRVRVAKVYAVENPRLSARFGVRAMPTVIGLADGQVVGQLVGARPRSAFVDLAEALAAGG